MPHYDGIPSAALLKQFQEENSNPDRVAEYQSDIGRLSGGPLPEHAQQKHGRRRQQEVMQLDAWKIVSFCPKIGDETIARAVPTTVVILPTTTSR